MVKIPLHVGELQSVRLSVKDDSLSLDIGGSFYEIGTPYYQGVYDLTPTEETQVIPIKDMRASANVTVSPIPQNYGLITWNGSTIMVS